MDRDGIYAAGKPKKEKEGHNFPGGMARPIKNPGVEHRDFYTLCS
ncbi:hypothetical protein DCCM_3310 [Desulfocucumis palustris]|uniref:Uncharacterized protein n=1 Tax=Desulfocucumis palustris TaxID=1898651 RepID=A0A2L2XD74_9FIRM|nr:hypothetical protein DCCM_3310 [Desulfocucumis palustris]